MHYAELYFLVPVSMAAAHHNDICLAYGSPVGSSRQAHRHQLPCYSNPYSFIYLAVPYPLHFASSGASSGLSLLLLTSTLLEHHLYLNTILYHTSPSYLLHPHFVFDITVFFLLLMRDIPCLCLTR